MTQLELPPISIGRYIDLLKRRRWQVVPVSLAGLLIGGIVAFFIPRYYVCDTMVEFRGSVLGIGPGAGSGETIRNYIGGASFQVRRAVSTALAKLGWPEAVSGSMDEKRDFVEEVRKRVKVTDLSAGEPGRTTAYLQISYRDTDATRARELTNTLREVWLESQRNKIRELADKELADVNRRIDQAMTNADRAEEDLRRFEQENGLNPNDFSRGSGAMITRLTDERFKLEAKLNDARARQSFLRKQYEGLHADLESTPKFKSVKADPAAVPGLERQKAQAKGALVRAQLALQYITENHPEWAFYQALLLKAEQELDAIEKLSEAAGGGEVENERWTQLYQEVTKLSDEMDSIDAQIRTHEEQLGQLKAQTARMPDISGTYDRMRFDLQQARKALDTYKQEGIAKQLKKKQLLDQDPYETVELAEVPTRPTEPDIGLLALAGSAIGIALAIGLVLLFDILQTTFKTVDDVQRLLPVPVLGGMSHMVTVEQRRDVVVRRTRASLVAGVFLVLMIAIVTIYYVAPTRLPPMLRDTLGLILGTPSAAK